MGRNRGDLRTPPVGPAAHNTPLRGRKTAIWVDFAFDWGREERTRRQKLGRGAGKVGGTQEGAGKHKGGMHVPSSRMRGWLQKEENRVLT